MRGSRGRRRGRRKSKAARSKRSSASSSSSSKSSKSKSKRRSTAASKRRKVRSVAKAARAAKRAAKASTSTSSSTSSSSKNKTKRKVNKLKLNKKDRQRQAQENAKKAFKKKNEQQKKTISASQSRKQAREKAKQARVNRKPISVKNVNKTLSTVGRTLRNIRQPISALSDAGVKSFLGSPAKAIAQGLANSPHTSDFNKRTRDFSKMTPQQQRRWKRLSEKTGRDYSIRNPTFRLNLGVDTLARFGGFADNKLYKALPKSIRSLKVDKQFYGNPMKKGWHSSQRTGRGQGLNIESSTENQLGSLINQRQAQPKDTIHAMYEDILGRGSDQEGLDYWLNEYESGRQTIDDIRNQFLQSDEYKQKQGGDSMLGINQVGLPAFGIPGGGWKSPPTIPRRGGRRPGRGLIPIMPIPGRPGFGGGRPDRYTPGIPRPPQVRNPELGNDWLGRFYNQYNIGGPEGLTDEARDYWTNEAKTKGIQQTMDIIEGTARANNTWGGRAKGVVDPGESHWNRRNFPRGKPPSRRRRGPIDGGRGRGQGRRRTRWI